MGENGIILTKTQWLTNFYEFEGELEEALSHCPNMIDRTLCVKGCPLYHAFCISIEPHESVLEAYVDE